MSAAKIDPHRLDSTDTQKRLLRCQGPDNVPAAEFPVRQAASSGVKSPPRLKSPTTTPASRRSSVGSSKQSDAESLEPSETNHDSPMNSGTRIRVPATSSASQGAVAVGPKSQRNAGGIAPKLQTVEEAEHAGSMGHETSVPWASQDSAHAGAPMVSHASNEDEAERARAGDYGKTERNDRPEKLPSTGETLSTQKASPALVPTRVRHSNNEKSLKGMVVETETVTSIPQATASGNPNERAPSMRSEANDGVRKKQSNDTIRPKRDKKARKPASIMSGTGSSKADMFEAKVASEIEGEGTDSDETFVYESNPTERTDRRMHSRTPSSTSVQSLADRRGTARSAAHLPEGQRAIRGKRSMKFASSSFAYAGSSVDDESGDHDEVQKTVLSPNGRVTATDPRYRSIRRLRKVDVALRSPSENTSPFSKVSMLRSATGDGLGRSLKPKSPKGATPPSTSDPVDFKGHRDVLYGRNGRGIEDEQAPLLSISHGRPPYGHQRPQSAQPFGGRFDEDSRVSLIRRLAGCFLMSLMLALVLFCVAAFLFATTTPLTSLNVEEIQNVLASEQEIMLDLSVSATNPNLIPITIEHTDINVFAKSSHVGMDSVWRESSEHRTLLTCLRGHLEPRYCASGGVWKPPSSQRGSGGIDRGTDPIDSPEVDGQTMLLGRIFHFDSALTFDGSLFSRRSSYSSGELRLESPGNKTETGGSERWERVMQHPFELIVRGVLQYQLPLSTKTTSKSISASAMIHPEDRLDGEDARMRL
ncbi:MAG: hypothetical protein M1828_006832 [Chrysothrix sp. TS-e1954]|nr:MAG: hypothetical protein M1828_006832 [Chrysothrix sp. TS-e1954]